MAAAAILEIVEILTFGRQDESRVSNCATVPNFVETGEAVAETWRFFQHGGRRHLGFVMRVSLDQPRRALGGPYHCANLAGIVQQFR